MQEPLRQVMRAAPGAGTLRGDDGASSPGVCTGRAEHPVCGDVVELDVQLAAALGTRSDAGVLVRLAWRASGCPATMAVAAAAHGALVGQPIARAPELLRQRLQALGGLAAAEQHAQALFLSALRDAVHGADAGATATGSGR